MKSLSNFALVASILLAGCNARDSKPAGGSGSSPTTQAEDPSSKAQTLVEARKGFKTKLVRRETANEPVPEPPQKLFQKVYYDAPSGKLAAYLTPDPNDGKKHPAIVWITGGDCNTIGELWEDRPPSNDQTAAAFRKAGIVMMFPSLRGGNQNPGFRESFLGEVDDVIAAADYLLNKTYVDSKRIYLGGHSTGGTLVLLVAESTDQFRAIFSFGPADDIRGYGPQFMPFDRSNPKEVELRSPGHWLSSIKSPTFVLEGGVQGNMDSLETMASASTNPRIHFLPVTRANHFNILAPINRLIADKILRDTGPKCDLMLTVDEVNKAFGK